MEIHEEPGSSQTGDFADSLLTKKGDEASSKDSVLKEVSKISEKFVKYIRLNEHPNGGAISIHADWNQIRKNFDPDEQKLFLEEFATLGFSEAENGDALFVMGVLENAASDLPDLLQYFVARNPDLPVKVGSLLNKQEITTMKISDYYEKVLQSCRCGTFNYGPMLSISLVGKRQEECGDYFAELLRRIESFPLMKLLLPWGVWSQNYMKPPEESDDGPIFWVRPGEQMVRLDENRWRSPKSGSRSSSGTRRQREQRELLFEDRTPSHADHFGEGTPTAAVGILQTVWGLNEQIEGCQERIVKDVVCFDASDYAAVMAMLNMNLCEPPLNQCSKWVDDAKLNQLRLEGIQYSHFQLRGSDIYFIPRRVVHQFRTISACSSIAWHVCFDRYHEKKIEPAIREVLTTEEQISEKSCISTPERTCAKRKRGRPRKVVLFCTLVRVALN